mmetsp:Transcript_115643/g.360188  ORF Transcript_115643/g.360188 Transcript_115643/m.360188 type:complete len:144 (+) Transcript_115643:62-493(+)
MAFTVPHLHSTYAVDQAVAGEAANKVVCIRMGEDFHPFCMQADELLAGVARDVESVCSVYAVDVREVPECVGQFQLSEPVSLAFFFRGRPLKLDLGAGPVQVFARPLQSRQELLDLVEAVSRGAAQGRDLILCPKDYSLPFGY